MSDKVICVECEHLGDRGNQPYIIKDWQCTPTVEINYITGNTVQERCEALNSTGDCEFFEPSAPTEKK